MIRLPARSIVGVAARAAAQRSEAQLVQRRALSVMASSTLRSQPQRMARLNAVSISHFHSTSLLSAETVKVPQMAESITEGTLKQFNKQVGDFVKQDEEIATIETDKIDVSVNAPMAGKITELLVSEEDTVTVGQDLLRIEPGEGGDAEAASGSSSSAEKEKKESQPPAKDDTKPDASVAEKAEPKQEQPKQEPKKEQAPAPKKEETKKESAPAKKEEKQSANEKEAVERKVQGSRNETRVKMSRMRQTIAKRLKQSQESAASLTTFNEIDMSSLMQFRSQYKDAVLKEQGVKLGFMSAFAKASCLALKEIPAANASIEGDTIIYRDYVDLSVAVATEKGLVTPVVRNAEAMNLVEIEQAIAGLGKKVGCEWA